MLKVVVGAFVALLLYNAVARANDLVSETPAAPPILSLSEERDMLAAECPIYAAKLEYYKTIKDYDRRFEYLKYADTLMYCKKAFEYANRLLEQQSCPKSAESIDFTWPRALQTKLIPRARPANLGEVVELQPKPKKKYHHVRVPVPTQQTTAPLFQQ